MSLKDLVERYLKSGIINIAKELKETISKELKKSVTITSNQIQGKVRLSVKIEKLFKNN